MQLETLEENKSITISKGKQFPLEGENLSGVLPVIVIKRFNKDEIFGGAEKFIHRLTTRLALLGINIEILSARLKPEWKKKEQIKINRAHIKIKRLPHPGLRFAGTLLYNLSLLFELLTIKNTRRVIHINFASKELITATLAKTLTGTPVICRIACAGETGELSSECNRFYGFLIKRALKNVDAFIALSEDIERELTAAGIEERKIHLIPNGVDTNVFSPPDKAEKEKARNLFGIKKGQIVAGFAGRLSAQKDLKTLIESIQNTPGELKLLIAGKGPEKEKIEKAIKDKGLEKKVSILGAVKDMKSFYSSLDIFILPSLFEGLSNSLLEAMSMGLAVIATDASGSRDLVRDGITGILIPKSRPDRLTEAINKLYHDTNLRTRLGEEARKKIVRDYSIESVALRYLKLYKNVLKTR